MTTAPAQSKITTRHNDYTGHAATYEEKRFLGRENEYLEMVRRRAVLAAIGPQPPDSCILDVGCGTGRGLLYLASAGFRRIIGLDYTPAMLKVARQHLDERGLAGAIRLVQGDAFALPWPKDSFDLVVSLNFLHMFTLNMQRSLIEEMARVCRPSGKIVVELESIHKGFFFTRFFEQRRLHHRTKFNSAWEMRRLFPSSEYASTRTIGTALPKLYRLLSHAPNFGARLELVAHFPPFNWLAERVVVVAQRRTLGAT